MSVFVFAECTNSSSESQKWSTNLRKSFDSVPGKENQCVSLDNITCSSVSSSIGATITPFKTKPVNRGIELVGKPRFKGGAPNQEATVLKLDDEIEEIKSEIATLRSRLDGLRLLKAVSSLKVENRNRAVSPNVVKKTVRERRRGVSMGPSDIFGAVKSSQFGLREIASPVLSRRKSCVLKLGESEQEKAVKNLSVPSRRLKKDDCVIDSVQSKKLVGKSAPVTDKKALRPARVVASRYNQKTRQRVSLEENDVTKSNVKKQWEIPSEIIVHCSEEDEESVVATPYLLPRIRTMRLVNESPRDSGPPKRVADLVGKKSFFADDGAEEGLVYQTLRYDEDQAEQSYDQF